MGDKISIKTGAGQGNVIVGKVEGTGNVVGIGNRVDSSSHLQIGIPQEKINGLPDDLRTGMQDFLGRINKLLADHAEKTNENTLEVQAAQGEIEAMVDETKAAVDAAKPAGSEPPQIPIAQKMSIGMRFLNAAKGLLKVLPQTAETIAAFTPLAPFSKVIGQGVGEIVGSISAGG